MDIYREILTALRQNGHVALATIIASSGSTPVSRGSKMLLINNEAIPLGTVGGGCVEGDVIETARGLLNDGAKCLVRRFTLTEDDIESGMLCGGTVDILIEQLTEEQEPLYAELVSGREEGSDAALISKIGPGPGVEGKILVSAGGSGIDEADLSRLSKLVPEPPAGIAETVRKTISQESVTRLPCPGGELVIEPVLGVQDLFIFGGGHVSRYVSRSASMAGFRVTVIDDRQEYANPQRFPEAYRTLAVHFEDAWEKLRVNASASIVIVTRGHKFDEVVLERAVRTPARYIGMIGSRRKVLSAFSNLLQRGTPRDLLRNVRAPVGLDIGAETAEEIGISITAELIAVRRKSPLPAAAMSDRLPRFIQTGSSDPKPGPG